MPSRSLPKSEYRAMADAYLAGGSFLSVAKQFGRSWQAVDTALAIYNIETRPVGKPKIEDDERFPAIRAAIAGGMSKTAAKKRFKISGRLINRALGEVERQEKAKSKKPPPTDTSLADEVEMAIQRDREWLREIDDRRGLMRVAA